jgi:hypothetical protein
MRSVGGCVLSVALFLGGCASGPDEPKPGDVVRDAAAAIDLGKKICAVDGFVSEGPWTATFSDLLWTVQPAGASDSKCHDGRVSIWADNGKPRHPCEICVVAA